jgi:hypothetical protein
MGFIFPGREINLTSMYFLNAKKGKPSSRSEKRPGEKKINGEKCDRACENTLADYSDTVLNFSSLPIVDVGLPRHSFSFAFEFFRF